MRTRAPKRSIRRMSGVFALVAVVGLAAGTASAQEPLPGPSLSASRAPTNAAERGFATPTSAAAAAPAAEGRVAIPVGLNPQAVALDSATHTLYEVSGGSGTVSVIDTRTCNAVRTSGCRRTPPTVSIGSGAGADSLAVDQATDTIYTTDPGSDGTGTAVSVIDGSTCNAEDHAGCGQVAHTVQAGTGAVAVDVDQATDTVYVTDLGTNGTGTTLSVIDGATCNGRVTTGCGQVPGTVTIGEGPAGVIVDQQTDTVYAGSIAPNGSQTIAVINGATCNARVRTGCPHPHLFRDGSGSTDFNVGFALDEQSHTLYATNYTDDAVSMFDTATCQATDAAGCGHHRDAAVGSGPTQITVNAPTHSIYVSNITDDSVSVLDAATCNAHVSSGCAARRRAIRTGLGPQSVIADPATDTIYTPNGDANTVSVLNGASCNATHASGCTPYPATVSVGPISGPFGLALNPRTHSLYVVDNGSVTTGTSVSVVNTAICNAHREAGCGQRPATVAVGQNPVAAAVDTATDTVYVTNRTSNTVSVINGATCNATHHAGCRRSPATVRVGDNPNGLAVDQATHTVYVADSNDGTVSVINAATCNATDHAGCGQRPRTITVGTDPRGIAVDQATDTVYVANTGNFSGAPGSTMSVIDGATCNATVASGCARHPQTVRTGPSPWGVAIDQATDTVYVTNANDFSGPGSVTVVDGALCNATHHGRCGISERTVRVGPGPFYPAVDQATGVVYVPDLNGATVSVIDGATCDATHHTGCAMKPGTVIVGGVPIAALVYSGTHTVYVSQDEDGTVSVLPAAR